LYFKVSFAIFHKVIALLACSYFNFYKAILHFITVI